jgi:nucleoside phosphorylase
LDRRLFPARDLCSKCHFGSISESTPRRNSQGVCQKLDEEICGRSVTHCHYFERRLASESHAGNPLPGASNPLPIDVAIVCAVQVEYEAVRQYLFDIGNQGWELLSIPNDGDWWAAEFEVNGGRLRVALAKSRYMGLAAAAALATTAIHVFKPRFLVMPGITAGRAGKTKIGDIVIPDRVWDHGEGRWEDNDGKMEFTSRSNPQPLDQEIYSWAEGIRGGADFGKTVAGAWAAVEGEKKIYLPPSIHIGPTVSGAAVIDSDKYWTSMIKEKKVIGLDMEAYGFALAAKLARTTLYSPDWIIAKSVCDFAANKDKEAQPYAAFCSTKFIEFFMRDYVMSAKRLELRPFERFLI